MSLTVKPLSAVLDKDTDTFGKADPYVVLHLGTQKKITKNCHNGGTTPKWSQSLVLNAKETNLKIEVWDKDRLSADDLMGAGTYDLKKVYANPKTPFTEYVNLSINEKGSGQILLQFQYTGAPINSGNQGQHGQGQNQQQQNWGQQGQQNWGQQGPQGQQQNWGQQGPQGQQQQNWGQPQQNWGQQGQVNQQQNPKGGNNGQGGFVL